MSSALDQLVLLSFPFYYSPYCCDSQASKNCFEVVWLKLLLNLMAMHVVEMDIHELFNIAKF